MDFFLKFDINIFSVILLVILFLTIKIRGQATGTSTHLYFRVLWVTVSLLCLEILSWKFDRIPGQNILNYTSNIIFTWVASISTCVLASYMDYHIFGSYQRLKDRWFYIHPFIATGFLLIINFFRPILFSVSEANVYSRMDGIILLPIVNVLTFSYICYLAYKNRKRIQREVVLVILLYVLMPVIAAFIQVKIFGVFILWPTMAVIVVLTYIFLETISTSKDYLTGLLSRHRIDDYLEYMLEQRHEFILVMIDLNKFKFINDNYGHLRGDMALRTFSETLMRKFKNEKVVGRYAGDEFILILDKMKAEEMKESLEQIKIEMMNLYMSKKIEFLISFSYGYYIYDTKRAMKYEEIMDIVDKKMYEHKSLNNI